MRLTRIVWLAPLLVACGGDDSNTNVDAPPGTADARTDAPPGTPDAPPGGFDVSGTVVGPNAAAGPVIAAWLVDGMSNDYTYKFGDGTSADGATFTMTLADLPVMARTTGPNVDFGGAFLVLLPPGTVVPDGIVGAPEPTVVGLSARHAIIYRGASDTGAVVPWTSAFPVGYSCGVCVDSTTGGFDSWAPTDCTTLVIDTSAPSSVDICNWM
jgi:hypothetical protein